MPDQPPAPLTGDFPERAPRPAPAPPAEVLPPPPATELADTPVAVPLPPPDPAPRRAGAPTRPASPAMERLVLVLVVASGALAAIVAPAAAIPLDEARQIALGSALGSLAVALAAAIVSLDLGTLRRLHAQASGGTVYDQLRWARPLRVASVLGQLLAAVTWILVLLRAVSRAGVGPSFENPVVERGLLVLFAALGGTLAFAHWQSLRTPTQRDRSGPTWVSMGLAFGATVVLLALGLLALAGAQPAIGAVDFEDDDVAFLALAGLAALAFALRRSRGLPGAGSLLADESSTERGIAPTNRTKAVLVPAILAFALLLVVFLLVLLFGIGIGEVLTTLERSPILLGALLFIVLALLGSLGLAMMLSRSAERDVPLYAQRPERKVRQVRMLLVGSGLFAAGLFALAVASWIGFLPSDLALHFICLGILVAIGPFGFYTHYEQNRIRRLEERFPDFLRDIASSHKGGLTLHQSVTIASRGEYGPLTPEVRKMADQLSWNVSFHEALERFGERVQTPLVQRAVNLILQADRSGGSTTDVLLAAARDARELKNLENERRTTMSLYTVVVYITFFVFLGVAATLYAQFAPAIVESQEAVSRSTLESSSFTRPDGGLDLEDFQLFYFVAAIVQAVGDGVVAGLLGSGKATLGLRHSFIMVLAAYLIFALLLV